MYVLLNLFSDKCLQTYSLTILYTIWNFQRYLISIIDEVHTSWPKLNKEIYVIWWPFRAIVYFIILSVFSYNFKGDVMWPIIGTYDVTAYSVMWEMVAPHAVTSCHMTWHNTSQQRELLFYYMKVRFYSNLSLCQKTCHWLQE